MLVVILTLDSVVADTAQWTPEKANAWYEAQPWLVGSNYNPASAVNQLEFWQADTFAPSEIDKELGWAEDIGVWSNYSAKS